MMAKTAFPSQENITDKRDVIVAAEPSILYWALGMTILYCYVDSHKGSILASKLSKKEMVESLFADTFVTVYCNQNNIISDELIYIAKQLLLTIPDRRSLSIPPELLGPCF